MKKKSKDFNNALTISINQILFSLDSTDFTIPVNEQKKLPGRLRTFYNMAGRANSDIQCYPQYLAPMLNQSEIIKQTNKAPFLILPEPCSGKSKTGMNCNHVFSILKTDIGQLGIATGTEFLYKTIAGELIIGLFVINYAPGILSFLTAIHKAFALNPQLQFVAFVNCAVNIPEIFIKPRKYPMAMNTSKDSPFWDYYHAESTDPNANFILQDNNDDDVIKAITYMSEKKYAYGNSGLFCRKASVVDCPELEKVSPGQSKGIFSGDREKRIILYPQIIQHACQGEDIVHLTCTDLPWRDYQLTFEVDVENQLINFKKSTPVDTPTFKKYETRLLALDRDLLSIRE